eukprot:GHVS01029403.1.p2 GENE.GHVS01029403.1~~GHVS01029403.1.p2  ORF type:complete len:188 (-),score=57.07 GHVS01029403.1:255-818(-)
MDLISDTYLHLPPSSLSSAASCSSPSTYLPSSDCSSSDTDSSPSSFRPCQTINNKPTNRQDELTDNHTHNHTDKQTDKHTDKQTIIPSSWLSICPSFDDLSVALVHVLVLTMLLLLLLFVTSLVFVYSPHLPSMSQPLRPPPLYSPSSLITQVSLELSRRSTFTNTPPPLPSLVGYSRCFASSCFSH